MLRIRDKNVLFMGKKLVKIEVTTAPTTVNYTEGDTLNLTGLIVTATFDNGTTTDVTSKCTYSPSGILSYGTTQIVISYTEGGETQTTIQPITVSIKTYDYTDSIVISESGEYTLTDIGATHRNIRVVCIGGGNGGEGGSNGSAGGSSNTISLNTNKSSRISNTGNGGAGGKGGTAGQGGKIAQKDYIISSLSDTFTISIGAGGTGGAISTNGTAGESTTFNYNNTITSSATGSSSATGYTNTFTNETYAVVGEDGIAGGAGGNGLKVTSVNSRYTGFNYTATTSGESVTYKGVEYTGGTINTKSERYLQTTNNEAIMLGYGCSGSGGAAAGSNGGPGRYKTGSTSSSNNLVVSLGLGYGGTGANAVAPETPTTFGNGGNGGNGGGGGGSATGGCIGRANVPTASDYYNKKQTLRGGKGGSGGTGSAGSAGAQGCVIIYFS